MKRTYAVYMAAPRNAGKTVMLSAVANLLSMAGAVGLYAEVAEQSARQRLARIHRSIASGDEWPEGTADLHEFPFDISVKAHEARFEVFRVALNDFPGDDWTNMDNPRLEDALRAADLVMGLFDGAHVQRLMRGESLREFEDVQMQQICARLDRRDHPAVVVITKYELLKEYSFEAVIARLLEVSSFRKLVENRNMSDQPVRVIPVSAVGDGFAVQMPDDSMRKTGKAPAPMNVEMVLACVVPEMLRWELARSATEMGRIENTPMTVDPQITPWDRFCERLGSLLKVLVKALPIHLRFSEDVIQQAADAMRRPFQKKREHAERTEAELRRRMQAQLREVRDVTDALNHAMTVMLQFERDLDRRFPASQVWLKEFEKGDRSCA